MAAGVEIADSEGLDAVTIRGIAARLDARAMSVYDFFESKDEILAAMADLVVEEVVAQGELPSEWRAAIMAIARRFYVTLVSHRWLALALSERPRFGPNRMLVAEQMLASTAELKLTGREAAEVMGIVDDYVLGHSLRAVMRPSEGEGEEISFEAGLETVLDGIEARLHGP